MITIEESGTSFGPFAPEHCWRVENCGVHAGMGEGVKMVEFVLLRPPKSEGQPAQLWLVEAKTTAPNPRSPVPGTTETFIEHSAKIRDKMVNALALVMASCLRRHPSAEPAVLPEGWGALDLGLVGFRFVVVVKNHEKAWLQPLQDALNRELRIVGRTWALGATPVVVLNEASARQRGLIA